METGRKWKGWKNLGGVELREMETREGRAWEGMEGKLGGCHLTFSS